MSSDGKSLGKTSCPQMGVGQLEIPPCHNHPGKGENTGTMLFKVKLSHSQEAQAFIRGFF